MRTYVFIEKFTNIVYSNIVYSDINTKGDNFLEEYKHTV